MASRRGGRVAAGPLAVAALVLAGAAGVGAAQEAGPAGAAKGDAYDDLFIGVPYEAIGAEATAGAFHLLRGDAAGGLTATGNQLWHQDVDGVLETAEAGDELGFALVSADFNGDSFPDLAAGVHGEAVGSIQTAGGVHVFYGTAAGLDAAGNQILHQGSPGIDDDPETDDRFGWALGAGDFDGDGYDDLAVGAIWEDLEGVGATNAGAVHVIYGSASGLNAAGSQVWYEDSPGLPGTSASQDQFGAALAAGDFDHDGHDDLVIGVPWNDTAVQDSGVVYVIYGADSGLDAASAEVWYQGLGAIADATEVGDRFGHAVATGDLDGDRFCDLAVGAPFEDIGDANAADAGAVHVLFGSAGGLTATGNQLWHQDVAGMSEVCEVGDELGNALAIGDFDGDSFADLAVGVDGEDVPGYADQGIALVLYGTAVGPTSSGQQEWIAAREEGLRFGWSMAASDFDGDGHDDLAVGEPWRDVGAAPVVDAGAVVVLRGSSSGLTSVGAHQWAQDSDPDIAGTAEAGDLFGLALAATHPTRLLFRDGFELGTTAAWSATTP